MANFPITLHCNSQPVPFTTWQRFPPNHWWPPRGLESETGRDSHGRKDQFAEPCDARLQDPGSPAEWLGLRVEEAGARGSNEHHWTCWPHPFAAFCPDVLRAALSCPPQGKLMAIQTLLLSYYSGEQRMWSQSHRQFFLSFLITLRMCWVCLLRQFCCCELQTKMIHWRMKTV